jgi:hypothetical protein
MSTTNPWEHTSGPVPATISHPYRRGFISGTTSVGWVFLECHRADRATIRCQRRDRVAYVLNGQRLSDHGMTGILGAACPASGDGR